MLPPPRSSPGLRLHRSLGLRAVLGPILAVAAAVGCSEPGPAAVAVRTPFAPPPAYDALWRQVEACSGRRGDPARVRWYHVASFPGQPLRLGQWEPDHAITLRTDLLEAAPIVSHEILHDLLAGDPEHLDPAWLACALPVAGARGGVPPSRRGATRGPEAARGPEGREGVR